MAIADTAAAPAEAIRDRESFARYGIKSTLAFPLLVSGGLVIGVLAFSALHRRREWSEPIVTQCRLLTQVFAGALARKRSELALRQSEERFRRLFDGAADAVFVHDLDGSLIDVNQVACDSLGYARDELLHGSVFDFEVGLQPAALGALWHRIGTGQSATLVGCHRRRNGTTFPVEVRIVPFLSPEGPCFFAAARDITERDRTERSLRESEARFRTLIGEAPVAIGMGRNGVNLYANEKYLRMFGFEHVDEVIGRPIADHWAPEYRALIAERARQRTMGLPLISEYEAIAQRKDGSQFPARISVTAVNLPDGRATLGFITDITEPKRAEAALQASEARFRSLIESAPVAIGVSRDGITLYCNRKYYDMFGFAPDSVLAGRPIGDYWASSSRQAIEDRARQRSQGLPVPTEYEGIALRQDGTEFPVHVAASIIDVGDGPATVAFLTDISERKRAEEVARQQQSQLAHLSRLTSVGEMASGLAHELNQPLTAILNYAEICAERRDEASPLSARMDRALRGLMDEANRAAQIIKRVRTFVRKQDPQRNLADIAEVIRGGVGLLAFELRRAGIRPTEQFAPGLARVNVDTVQIQQVMVNLIQNAIDAMANTPPKQRRLVVRIQPADGPIIHVEVEDSGCGLPPEIRNRVFESFVTTKSDGLGLGLAISRSIIESHGGHLEVRDNVEGGTIFRFSLPVTER